MAEENIIVNITCDADLSAAQVELKRLQDEEKALKKEMDDISKAEEAEAQRIKNSAKSWKELQRALAENKQYYKDIRQAQQESINATEKSINTFKKSISTYNLLNGSQQKVMTQIRQLRQEMTELSLSGETNSERFLEMADRAATLQQQMAVSTRTVQTLSSATRGLDTVMGVGQGLTGTFNLATSAMALLGGESEQLQQAFYKVQAAMTVLNSVQQLSNVMMKNSATNISIRTALTKLFTKSKVQETAATTANTAATAAETVATKGATVATKGLTAALLANPIMLVVAAIAALVAGVSAYISHSKKAAAEQRNFNGELERFKKLNEQIANDTDYLARVAAAEGKSQEEILEIKRQGALEQEREAQKLYDNLSAKAKKAGTNLTDEEQQRLKEALDAQKQAAENVNKINQEITIYAINKKREQAEAENQRLADEEKARKEAWKRRKKEIDDAAKQLQDVNAAMIADEQEREIEQTRIAFERKIADVKGNSETEKALRKALQDQMEKEINGIKTKYAEKSADEAKQKAEEEINREYQKRKNELAAEENYYRSVLADENATDEEIADAKEKLAEHDAKMRNIELQYLNEMHEKKLISEEDYNARVLELEGERLTEQGNMLKQARENEAQDQQEQLDKTMQYAEMALDALSETMTLVFDAIGDHIQQQLDALDDMYTTDVEEAQNSANKKYISEKELEKKKADLKLKQQKLNKADALFQIGLNTAMAIMRIWADVPKADFGATTIALTAVAAALGTAQLAAAAAKPLSQYAKGRKGGEGEMALVGEKGPEIMYVPQGASIIPNNKIGSPDAWGDYGVPTFSIPAMPNVNGEIMKATMLANAGVPIDYDRLGKAVAENMPKQKAVTINVDRNGLSFIENGNATQYLNTKYNLSVN